MPQASTIDTPISGSTRVSRVVLFRDGIVGILARIMAVTAGLLLTFLVAWLLKQQGLLLTNLETSALLGIWAVVWTGMALGVVFSEFPKGVETGLARVGLATFCRTGLPLVVILFAVNYATRLHSVAAYTGMLYAVGLLLSLYLELSKLGSFPLIRHGNES